MQTALAKVSKNISRHIKQTVTLSKSASKAYKVTILLMFIILFIISMAFMQIVITQRLTMLMVTIRSLLGAFLYVSICHVGLRPYLKLYLVNRSLSLKKMANFVGFTLVLAIISFLFTLLITKMDYFDPLDFTKVQFSNENGTFDAQMDHHSIFYLMAVLVQMFSFFIWSLFYIVWYMYRAKKQLQKQMQLAQIQQLTNQLSPHFLFNTFNSIRALIYEDQDKAADTLTQLSELFRTHLQAHLRAISNLAEEWQVGQGYLAIEQTRLEERLTIKVNIDEALYQQKLPTLTLLTLLENATKHGISPNIEPGFIEICGRKKDDKFWQLSVVNSVGVDSKAQGTQTGLTNIETRLALMFTHQSSFHYEKNNKQFSVTLELPYV